MKKHLFVFFLIISTTLTKGQSPNSASTLTFAASNFTLCSIISPETYTNAYGCSYSGCWGWYQADKHKEYAIAGSASGTYWVDVTNPYSPVVCDYEPGKKTNTVWREIKTYQNYCYVVSDDGGPNSFQIFDMQYLPDSVHKVHDSQLYFKRTHALWVDGDRLYCSSVTYSDNSYSSLNVYSLATPSVPVLLRKLNQDAAFITTAHDTYANHDTVFVSAAYQGLYAFVLTPPTYSFTQVGSLTSYPFSGYNHSSALTPDRKTLVFTDEVPAQLPIKIADVQNLSNIQVLSTINQFSTTTPHNPFMANDSMVFMSSYCDGLQLFNIKNPNAPFLMGYFDTHPQGGANVGIYYDDYDGQWGSYPFFPSKNVFALDETNGIFMLKSNYYTNNTNGEDNGGGLGVGTGVGTNTGTILTGIKQENQNANSIIVYPNPVLNKLIYNIPVELLQSGFEVSITDVTGKIIYHLSKEQSLGEQSVYRTVQVDKFANGIYFFRLYVDSNTLKNSKFIIAH